MHLLDIFAARETAAAERNFLFSAGKGALSERALEVLADELFGESGLDVSGKGNDHIFRIVALGNIGKQIFAREALYVFCGAENGSAVALLPEIRLGEDVETEVVGVSSVMEISSSTTPFSRSISLPERRN